ncbi:hypothetical protein ACOMHN_038024 [Nucella lapillus]
MMSLKTVGAFAVIIGCFAVVYPRFLHPFVLRAFGIQPEPVKEDDAHYPPHMRHGKPPSVDRKPPPMPHDPKDIRQHIRPGPHPGMRAAAEMQKQSQGTGRGMMGIVLPMYAIGICVYLVYTLFKVFNKRGKYPDPYTKRRSEPDQGQLDSMGFPKAMQGFEGEQEYVEGEVQKFLRQKQQERELEDLLVKMDDSRNVSEDEMRALQKRLEETEAQMTRILQAMQTMQSRTGTGGQAAAPGEGAPRGDSTAEDTGTQHKAPGTTVETVGTPTTTTTTPNASSSSEESQKESQEGQSRASSPDTESYEMVKKSASANHDTSPVSEVSSRSSFEQINQVGEGETAEVGAAEGGRGKRMGVVKNSFRISRKRRKRSPTCGTGKQPIPRRTEPDWFVCVCQELSCVLVSLFSRVEQQIDVWCCETPQTLMIFSLMFTLQYQSLLLLISLLNDLIHLYS